MKLSLLLLLLWLGAETAQAQSITSVSDGTQTIVTPRGQQFDITGGTQAGSNLFHSFQRFGLNQEQTANFLSNPSIANILGRVTGGQASVINGRIQVTGGSSNLYLMNPAGIVFGQGASLNVPGAFTATTANGISVGNSWFNATGPNNFANLTAEPNGFAFLGNPGAIVNAANLSLNPGQSLTLLGGTVINTGTIAAPGGTITIAAVPGENLVRISQTGSLLSLALPTETRSTLNSPEIAPLSLPELLTVGNAASPTGAGIDNGVVKLARTGTTIPTAPGTTIVDGLLSADAIGLGNGGNIHVLGEQTQFFGNITARGGSLGGNGGFVDTSGYQVLSIAPDARVITSAPLGQMGTWLIDPATLTVVAAGGTAVIGGGTNTPVAATTIDAGTIVTGLNGTNINLQATTAITVNAAINASANAAAGNLALTAPTANLNQPITLRAGSTLSGTATTVNVGATGTVQNGVDVAASGGTVNLAAATYTLAAQVNINKNLTLRGAGSANTTVSGNNAVRVFQVSGVTATIESLTIANGNTNNGGGILNFFGTLTVNNSAFTGNTATISGGGIASAGTLTINNSTFAGNRGNVGGGVYNQGTASVINSTFSGNTATGIYGGGIVNLGTLTISNSTFTGNSATNGGGGVYNQSALTIGNSIVTGNTAPVGAEAFNNAGTFTSSGNNLVGQNGNAGGFPTVATDIVLAGATNTAINPTLVNKGGPTQTHALTFNSSAIEAGNSAIAPTTDQRGFARFGNTDIGAVEYQFKVVNTNNTGVGSLRNALTNANTFAGTDTVIFRIPTTDPGYTVATNSWSIAPTSALPTITEAAIVDATTQPGYTTRPVIELNGTNAGAGVNGLIINAGNSTVRGFTINRFGGNGILLQTNGGNTVTASFIGTDVTGTLNQGNTGNGISVNNIANNAIGSGILGAGNLISGNVGNGILVSGAGATGTIIQGNRIGVDATGTADLGNGREGVRVTNAASNTLIGTNADGTDDVGERNIISGNYRANNVILPDNANIRVDTNANTTRIAGNYIGTNTSGTALPTGQPKGGVRGVQVYNASNTTIGGPTAVERNIISGNLHVGTEIVGTNLGNRILGNYIGTNAAGTAAIANGNAGVQIYFAANTTIGGTNPGEGNLISGNTVRGIAVIGDANTINNTIQGNFIGTNAAGTAALGNGNDGITLFSVGGTTIGGNGPGAGNLISGNTRVGVFVNGASPTGNTIQGNRIGTDVTGTANLGNLLSGITLNGASNTLIGTNGDGVNDANERNVISGNDLQGNTVTSSNANVQIFNATNTRVAGNYIGTNASGTALPTGQLTGGVRGIQIRNSTNTTIGGSTAAERNIVSGNQHMGIEFVGGGTTGSVIGNYIGTDVTGNSAIANGTGVSTFFANNQTIGGVNPGEGNLISGNTNDGISFVGNTSTNNRAIGNRIGTNAAGTAAVGNGNGVRILAGATNNQVGNDGNGVNDAAEGNLISGNTRAGIRIEGANNNRIAGNLIGVGANGTTAIGNAQDGVVITDAAANSVTGNLIANNGRGVAIVGATSTGNSVLVNSIFGNGAIGIDLGRDGITPNSSPSTANNGQAFPLLISATGNTVTGLLNSTPNTTYRLEFFSSPTTDQGQTFLGTLNVTTNAAGIANFSAPVAAIPAGVQVSATATSLTTGSTSEFSAAPGITLTAPGGTPQTTVVNTSFATALQGTVRDSRGNPAGGVTVNFVAPAAGATGALTGTLITNLVGQVNNPTTANTIAGTYTVTATAPGAPAIANFSLTNRPDLPASLTALGSTSQTTTVNTAFATPLQVNVRDQFGNVVPGAIVNFGLPGSGASAIGNVTATTDATGNANLTLIANTIAGTYSTIATVNGLDLSFNLTNTPGAPAVIRATSGNGQTALVTRAFRRPLQVQVTDRFGNLLSGIVVTFSSPTTGASGQFIGSPIVTTDVNGLTPALSFTANAIAGRYSIAVSTTGLTVTPFRLNNSPVPNETSVITDLQGRLLRSQAPTLLNLSPLVCVQRPVPKQAIDEYRDLPNCPLPSPVDRETRKFIRLSQ